MQLHINRITTLHTRSEHKTLLETMEANGIQAEYHCRDGHCGACRCTLISGEVEYLQAPLAFLNQGEILPCSCKAKTDLVIDNVKYEVVKILA